MLLVCIGISQFVPLAPLYGVTGLLDFCVPLLFLRYQLQYVKGLFVALNSRSVYTRNMLRYTVLGAGLRQFEGSDRKCVCKWLPSFLLQFRPVGHRDLCPAPRRARCPPASAGAVSASTDGSKEGDRHGWSAVLVDTDGVFVRLCLGALLLCGSSWVAEWCGKGLAVCVLCELGVPPDTVLGFVADNVSATFGADGYVAFLEAGATHEYYVPAQHDTLRRDLVAGWQEASVRLAHDGLSVARAGSVLLPTLLGGTMLLLQSSVLVCDVLRALDDTYASECASRSPPAGPFDPPCWVRCLGCNRKWLMSEHKGWWHAVGTMEITYWSDC